MGSCCGRGWGAEVGSLLGCARAAWVGSRPGNRVASRPGVPTSRGAVAWRPGRSKDEDHSPVVGLRWGPDCARPSQLL